MIATIERYGWRETSGRKRDEDVEKAVREHMKQVCMWSLL